MSTVAAPDHEDYSAMWPLIVADESPDPTLSRSVFVAAAVIVLMSTVAVQARPLAFAPQQSISSLSDGAYSVMSADVDGDGDMGVFSASNNDDEVAVYRDLANVTVTIASSGDELGDPTPLGYGRNVVAYGRVVTSAVSPVVSSASVRTEGSCSIIGNVRITSDATLRGDVHALNGNIAISGCSDIYGRVMCSGDLNHGGAGLIPGPAGGTGMVAGGCVRPDSCWVNDGDAVDVTAIADDSISTGWTGNVSSEAVFDNPPHVVMREPRTITAWFTPVDAPPGLDIRAGRSRAYEIPSFELSIVRSPVKGLRRAGLDTGQAGPSIRWFAEPGIEYTLICVPGFGAVPAPLRTSVGEGAPVEYSSPIDSFRCLLFWVTASQ